jgi:hypothetical protein
MSKYVRLKDGTICDGIDNYKIDEDGNYCEIVSRWGKNEEVIMIPKEVVEKESDNLEDLFDAVITFSEKYNNRSVVFRDDYYQDYEFYEYLSKEKDNVLKEIDNDIKIFASIWVDGDLIKVAKLNEDGKWELI